MNKLDAHSTGPGIRGASKHVHPCPNPDHRLKRWGAESAPVLRVLLGRKYRLKII